MNSFPEWIGAIGGIFGLISILVTLWHCWRNSKPRLNLFAPYNFTGISPETRKNTFIVFIRISNSSDTQAYLYFETLYGEIFTAGKWHKISWQEISSDHISIDFSHQEQLRFGIKEVKVLKRFSENFVSKNNPLSGYICFIADNDNYFNHPSAIRIHIRDSNLRKHVLKCDFVEQLKYDPARLAQK